MPLVNFFKDDSATTSVGLDLGNFSVKIAQIKKTGFSPEPSLSFAVTAIKKPDSRESIIEAIKESYKKARLDSPKVNISICGSKVVMRYIILPLMKEKDFLRSLEFELEKYIPYKKEDVVTDFRILAKLSNNKMIALLVAAEQQFIQERVSLVKEAGLAPQFINVDTLALGEAFCASSPSYKGVAAVLDIGYRLSKLVVLEDKVPYFSRDIETGEYDIIQAVSQKMSLDFAKAKELLYSPVDKAAEIALAIGLTLNSLIDEITLSFEYCERNLEKQVGQLYLSGGGSRIKALSDAFNRMPDLKVTFLDPTRGFKVSSSVTQEEYKEFYHLLAVAIGLAMA